MDMIDFQYYSILVFFLVDACSVKVLKYILVNKSD